METLESQMHAGVEAKIDLLEFLSAFLRNRYRAFVFSGLLGICAYSATYLLDEKFEAITRIIIVERSELGGVSPDNRRAPEVMTLVEHGFIVGASRDNQRDVIIAKMRSRTFTDLFIEKSNIAKYLFPEKWNDHKNSWVNSKPDHNEVFSIFHEQIRFIDHDPKTDIISVRIRFTDPRLASLWANQYVSEFNIYMRSRAQNDSIRKQEYLVQQLQTTQVIEMQQSLYRLMEAQNAVMMIAESKTEYAVEILDRAYIPFERFSPARKRIAILTTIGAFMFTIFVIFSHVVIQRVRIELKK